MIELNERPVRQNQLAAKLIAVFFALAAAMAATLMLHIGPKLPLQVLFLLFAGFGVFVWYRSYYIVYYYVLTAEYGEPQFIVVQQNGKRRSTVCRFRVDEIEKIKPCETRGERAERDYRFYSYCVSLFPARAQILYANGEFGATAVKIEATDEFIGVLSSLLPPSENESGEAS